MSVPKPPQTSTNSEMHPEPGKVGPRGTPSPEQASLLPSRLTFSWFTPFVLRTRGDRPVSKADLMPISDSMSSEVLSETFEGAWDAQEHQQTARTSRNRLLRCILGIHWKSFMLSGLLHVIAGASLQLTPFALGFFLQTMEEREAGTIQVGQETRGYLWCAVLFGLLLLKSILGNQGYYLAYKTGIRIRSSLSSAIFNHMLEMSNGAKQIYPVGHTIKLVSADILKILNVLDYLHYLWLGPFQIVFTFVMVYFAIGWPALLSLGLLCLAIPVQFLLTRLLVRNREMVCAATDKRIRVLQEMILGIRVIKLYGWESLFMRRLEACRAEELRLIRRQNLIYGCSILLSVVVPAFSTVLAFLAYSLDGNPLVASVVSQVSLYFSMLDIPLFNIPLFINTGIDTRQSLRRIQDFLASDRLVSDVQELPVTEAEWGLLLLEGDFDWDPRTVGRRKCPRRKARKARDELGLHPSGHPPNRLLTITPTTTYDMEEHTWIDASIRDESEGIFCLRDIELRLPKGSLVAIVGPVGSGKSSLLQAILGEMRSDGGATIQVAGRIGYCPQQAWIMNGSVRENILFGRSWDEERYRLVLRQCAIDTDVSRMPQGDATLIGEKGISLSGGQKARLNLARAVYADPDLVLLDDPLSAVDARVGNHLFQRCILDGLLRDKTRILVTHQLAVLPQVDHVVVLRHGRVSEQGSYAELMSRDSAFAQMMRRFIQEEPPIEPGEPSSPLSEVSDETELEEIGESGSVDEPGGFEANATGVLIDPVRPAGAEAKTIVASQRPRGTYSVYIRLAGGVWIVIAALLAVLVNEFFRAGNDLWLTVWMLRSPWSMSETEYRIIYVGFACGLTLLTLTCVLLFTLAGVKASARLHQAAAMRLFRSPIGFFEATPLGRILNRFSRDQEVVDTQLSDCIYFWLYIVATMASTYLFLALVSWRMAVALTLAFLLVILLQRLYATCNWKVNKLYAHALSPFMRLYGEVHSGLAVIRAARNEPLMACRYHVLADDITRASLLSVILKRWTSLRVELLGAFLVLSVALLCWIVKVPSQLAGKLLEFTLLVINSMDYFVRQYAEMESNMVAVDRLHSYASKLENEALEDTRRPHLDPAWPRSGTIELRNLTVAYRPHLPPVVRDVSVSIPHGHKVAIVGRTGAGKSTILSAIFRLVEPTSGTILIDGMDIRELSLNQLRSRITIVPQDPVLFSGTIRFNLDPAGDFTDADLWDALDAVNSRGFVAKLPNRLDTVVQDFGENFSLGQRQLICFARAILHRSPVILMDEPTASMDMETDELVQDAIRRCFADCTVINISHRLGTIKEYDKVIVMDAGKIIEYDSPEALLSDPSTILAQLYSEYSQYH